MAVLADDEVPVADLLRAAVDEATTLARPVTYDVRVVPDDLTVHADRARLHQLVSNLLDNASRHSPAGGVVRVVGGGRAGRLAARGRQPRASASTRPTATASSSASAGPVTPTAAAPGSGWPSPAG